MKVKSEDEVAEPCLTRSDPVDCSLPGSSVMGFSRQEYWSGVPLPSAMERWRVLLNGVKGLIKVTPVLKRHQGISLVVQWLRFQAPNAGSPGSISGQGSRFCVPPKDPTCCN